MIENGKPEDWIDDAPGISAEAGRMYQVDVDSFVMPNTTSSALGRQEGGNHYKDMAIQPVEFIHRNRIGFCAGNVIKYVCRYQQKNGVEDLKKARHYIDLLIQLECEKDMPYMLK